eukprot:m.11388 g.11388  ORF g.11388 m.11388 type:complete len:440 (-) comp8797_c0_seq1:200-1519(-)
MAMFPRFARPRRVVVTGIGLVTPLGVGVRHNWEALIQGKSGIRTIDSSWNQYTDAFESLSVKIAGIVPNTTQLPNGGFDASTWLDRREIRIHPDNIQFGLCAAAQAITDSKLFTGNAINPERMGVAVGCGISGAQDLLAAHDALNRGGPRKVGPFLVPNSLVNMTAGLISIKYGLQGPNHSVSTACATGAHAIGDAFRFVSLGDADVMVCGGVDACIAPVVLAGFGSAKALTTKFNDNPTAASRPFDRDRSGFVIAEGAGVLILEELEHALERGAPIYCEMRGYGLSADAHHITAPSPDGRGALNAMTLALHQARLEPSDISYVNAHATSTPIGDEIETLAIHKLMSSCPSSSVAVSSTKGATGHLLGAAGAIEAAYTIMSVIENVIPATLNADDVQDVEGIELIRHTSIQRQVDAALSNSFGFGGTNASLCFAKYHPK